MRKQIFGDGGDGTLAGFHFIHPLTSSCLSSHSQLILPHTYGVTTRVDDELIVWHWPLNRMKRRGPGNVISQYNYIPNGLSSTKDVKWWCALSLSGESQQRHFGQRPLAMTSRTPKALCYHLPTRQTLTGHFPDRGNNMSLHWQVVMLIL